MLGEPNATSMMSGSASIRATRWNALNLGTFGNETDRSEDEALSLLFVVHDRMKCVFH
jgi:hypothetical protein